MCASGSPPPGRARSLRRAKLEAVPPRGPWIFRIRIVLLMPVSAAFLGVWPCQVWPGQVCPGPNLPVKLSRHHADSGARRPGPEPRSASGRGRRRGGSCRPKMKLKFLAAASRVIRRRAAARSGAPRRRSRRSHEADATVTGRNRPVLGQSRGMEVGPGNRQVQVRVGVAAAALELELELELTGRSSGHCRS